MRNYYDILQIRNDATQAQIKKQYRRLAFKNHPDRNSASNATEIFNQISTAYHTLSDPIKRKEYDANLNYSASLRTHSTKPKPSAASKNQPPKKQKQDIDLEKRIWEELQKEIHRHKQSASLNSEHILWGALVAGLCYGATHGYLRIYLETSSHWFIPLLGAMWQVLLYSFLSYCSYHWLKKPRIPLLGELFAIIDPRFAYLVVILSGMKLIDHFCNSEFAASTPAALQSIPASAAIAAWMSGMAGRFCFERIFKQGLKAKAISFFLICLATALTHLVFILPPLVFQQAMSMSTRYYLDNHFWLYLIKSNTYYAAGSVTLLMLCSRKKSD